MNKRNSNMELLRITAMLMIICYHIFYHCINVQLTDIDLISKSGSNFFCYPRFSYKLCILAIISPMGQIGNAIFLIISGYFMAPKEYIDLLKISKKLIFQLGFAALILGLVSIYSYYYVTGVSLKLLQFNSFNYIAWYIGYYFSIILIAKLFLNKYLQNLNQKNYLMFLFAIFALLQFSWSEGFIASIANGLEILCTGIFAYSLGGYIRKHNPFDSLRLWVIVMLILIINILVIGNFYRNTLNGILEYNANNGNQFIQYIPGYLNNQIVPLALSICIFELFRRVKISNNHIINYLGASTFMVYLIHDNQFAYNLWYSVNWISLLHKNISRFAIIYLMWIIGIFIVGFICYCVYQLIGKILQYLKPIAYKDKTNII